MANIDREISDEETDIELDSGEFLDGEELELFLQSKKDDQLLLKIIDEFVIKTKGLFTREEILDRLNSKGFKGLALINEEDYFRINRNYPTCSGAYSSVTKYIYLFDNYDEDSLISIGTHELTHALLDLSLKHIVKDEDDNCYVYGEGLEEGICSYIELLKGSTNVSPICSYRKNLIIIRELDLLYLNSKYKRYDSIAFEAVKDPEHFIELISNLVFDNINDFYKKSSKDIEVKELVNMALRCSFIILHGIDLIQEISKKYEFEIEEYDNKNILKLFATIRFIIAVLLSNIDDELIKGNISSEYDEIFFKDDFKIVLMSDSEKLMNIFFNDSTKYYNRLLAELDYTFSNYTSIVDNISGEHCLRKVNIS